MRNKPEFERLLKKYILVKNHFKRLEVLCLINLNREDFEKYNFWSKTVLSLKSIKLLLNKPEFERFLKKYILVKNHFKRSEVIYLCLINLNPEDFEKYNFWSKTV